MISSAIDNYENYENYEILLAKLKDVGTSSRATKWFRSYLTSRY